MTVQVALLLTETVICAVPVVEATAQYSHANLCWNVIPGDETLLTTALTGHVGKTGVVGQLLAATLCGERLTSTTTTSPVLTARLMAFSVFPELLTAEESNDMLSGSAPARVHPVNSTAPVSSAAASTDQTTFLRKTVCSMLSEGIGFV